MKNHLFLVEERVSVSPRSLSAEAAASSRCERNPHGFLYSPDDENVEERVSVSPRSLSAEAAASSRCERNPHGFLYSPDDENVEERVSVSPRSLSAEAAASSRCERNPHGFLYPPDDENVEERVSVSPRSLSAEAAASSRCERNPHGFLYPPDDENVEERVSVSPRSLSAEAAASSRCERNPHGFLYPPDDENVEERVSVSPRSLSAEAAASSRCERNPHGFLFHDDENVEERVSVSPRSLSAKSAASSRCERNPHEFLYSPDDENVEERVSVSPRSLSAKSIVSSRVGAIAIILIAFLVTSTFAAEQKTSNAPFLKPKDAVAKMDIPDDFEVSIYVADPDIGEPIAFTFDDKGRVWVVENYNYVNRRSHTTKEVTRIQIFEDTDSDGVFDTKKLFTDKLTFSSGIAVGFGGVYVGTPPNLIFIPDADGDDKPDGPARVLLDGWGINDRHETLNSFIWGPDGWLYGCHGVFTQSLVGKPGQSDSKREFIDGGIWRYHPTKKEFEIFAHGLSNPWGFDFNDEGQAFATCCVIPHLFHIVQGGTYHKQSKPHLNPYVYDFITTIRDHTHRSAHGGARFYLADTFPEKYKNQLFMCNIHQHQVLTDVMHRKGSSYIGSHGEDFISTNDLAWVGFSVEIGPDGGVYILDWHDTDICGNAINFPDSGRIYRIMPKGAKPIKRPHVGALSDAELVAMQNHTNDWYVRQARLQLQMRLASGKLDQKATAVGLERMLASAATSPKRLRALWALHVTGSLSEKRLMELLDHSDEYVRAFTVQFLSEDRNPSSPAKARFADLAKNDSSAVVRLYLASACQRMEYSDRWAILGNLSQHAEDVEDNNIPRMLWFALEPMVPNFPEKSLEIAVNSKIPKLQEHVARRLVSGDLAATPAKKKKGKYPRGDAPSAMQRTMQLVAPGFTVRNVGEGGVRRLSSFRNEEAVQTHPLDRMIPCGIYRNYEVPKTGKTTLKIRASYHPHGDWQLRVRIGRKVVAEQLVSYEKVKDEWLNLDVDLSVYAGQNIEISVENGANNWRNEFGYWGAIKIVNE